MQKLATYLGREPVWHSQRTAARRAHLKSLHWGRRTPVAARRDVPLCWSAKQQACRTWRTAHRDWWATQSSACFKRGQTVRSVSFWSSPNIIGKHRLQSSFFTQFSHWATHWPKIRMPSFTHNHSRPSFLHPACLFPALSKLLVNTRLGCQVPQIISPSHFPQEMQEDGIPTSANSAQIRSMFWSDSSTCPYLLCFGLLWRAMKTGSDLDHTKFKYVILTRIQSIKPVYPPEYKLHGYWILGTSGNASLYQYSYSLKYTKVCCPAPNIPIVQQQARTNLQPLRSYSSLLPKKGVT